MRCVPSGLWGGAAMGTSGGAQRALAKDWLIWVGAQTSLKYHHSRLQEPTARTTAPF